MFDTVYTMSKRWAWAGLLLLLLVTRFAHLDVLWVEEAYPTAAAREILAGKMLYRDIWFDKPPLFPVTYLLWGASTGWPLRLAGALFVLLCCWIVSRWAGLRAALLLAFFLTFWIPSAVMALTPDLLLLPLHVGAVYLAWRGKPFTAGALGGIGLLFNAKAIFVLPACLLFNPSPWVVLGFILPPLLSLTTVPLTDYWQQVWAWGAAYSADHPFTNAFALGAQRTANWLGFHAALVVAAIPAFRKDRRLIGWALLSLFAVCLGARFFPRYYFQLLPALVIAAALGWQDLQKKWRYVALALLLIPLVRFGPRYVDMYLHHPWRDLAMYEGSSDAAGRIRSLSRPGDTLLVWGYRPELFPLTGLHAGTRFLDSQPLTGVIADRHLTDSHSTAPELAAANRKALVNTTPTWIVDGLGPYNPALDIRRFGDLVEWFSAYNLVADLPTARIYRRR